MREIIHPRQVVLVTARGKADVLGRETLKDNIITVAWHSPLSFDPEMYGICVGKNRFSYKLIEESKVFCVNFIPYEMKDLAVKCGMTSGQNVDKFKKFGLTKEQCDTVDCCRIKESLSSIDCEVVDQIETGDHIFFVGKVLRKTKRDDKKRLFHRGGDSFTSTL